MQSLFLYTILLVLSSAIAFGPTRNSAFLTKRIQKKEINMVIYWSIKSAIDYAGYAVGATDKFQGTGVFSGIKIAREKSSNEDSDATSSTEKKNSSIDAKKSQMTQKTETKSK